MNIMRVKKLIEDLDYWIFIGIGDDIVSLPGHRSEYQHLVKEAKSRGIESNRIPIFVLRVLKLEAKRHALFQPTQWRLFFTSVRGIFN